MAEAGFYPGILLYFTYWFPAATRARILALFCAAFRCPTSWARRCRAGCWAFEGHGFKGWQWMYLLEGIPTLALGFVALWGLPDNPRKATFLSEREKDIVMARLAAEDRKARGARFWRDAEGLAGLGADHSGFLPSSSASMPWASGCRRWSRRWAIPSYRPA